MKPPTGKTTAKKNTGSAVTRKKFMAVYRRGKTLPRLELDPRIDLTKPIYEQVMDLMAKDQAAAERGSKRRRQSKAA